MTDPVKRVCYADYPTVWASGVNIPELEASLNNYLEEITAYLKDNSLLISAPKSSVTLLTPHTHQAKTHPSILIEDSRLPLVKCPRILGVYLDPSLSFNKSIDHLHTEAEILKVREHSELLSAQYLAICLEPGNVCHPIKTRATPERQMKETLDIETL